MAQCQKCYALLEGDFGVINCTQCGEINFLDDSPDQSPNVSTEPIQQNSSPAWEPPPFAAPPDSDEKPMEPFSPPSEPQAEIKEIADFGNQNIASAETGVLLYEVHIARIDTSDIRKSLVEALKDSKFRWNADELEASIKNGKLSIPNLSPLKASLLIKRIRHLDLEIYWKQGTIYETSPT